jgi:diphosphomevalonate decarboxylase
VIEQMQPGISWFTATAPSNIAFVKYWGKRNADLQWPANDSLSMTLSDCQTVTHARRVDGNTDIFHFGGKTIYSDVEPNHKVFRHLQRLRKELQLSGALEIRSRNLFPTGCGIASSASGFAALTIAAAAALTGEHEWERLSLRGLNRERLAHLARRGSGSACRSLFGGFVHWHGGATADTQKIEQISDSAKWQLADVIIVLSDQEKHTSSTEAHGAAWGSPLFLTRLAGVPGRLTTIQSALENRDIRLLGQEIENEALEMHAVAMTGAPAVNYFLPETSKFTAWVRNERLTRNFPAWFTIDAGPNLHLICEATSVTSIISNIKSAWPNVKLIIDRVGDGPTITRGLTNDNIQEIQYV